MSGQSKMTPLTSAPWHKTLAAVLPGLLLMLSVSASFGQDLRTVLDLCGQWKFEVGDNLRWAEPSYSDKDWVSITVPAQWETQGFPGYDGYAWYRLTFDAPKEWSSRRLYLDLGLVDDVDEVFLNGNFIGWNGSFPPHYITAYNNPRLYPIVPGTLIPGEKNVLAVRVYDNEMGGGIIRGNISILEDIAPLIPDQSLEGYWKFKTGDDLAWIEPGLADRKWESVRVPSYWETQGHRNYDGFAWYRHTFRVPGQLAGERLILFMGKIDDFDEVYLNGQRIGRTGNFGGIGEAQGPDDSYSQWRAYTIPTGLLRSNSDNVLAVRVLDRFWHGGIYEGPVGLVRRDKYMDWESRSAQKQKKSPWRFLEWLFD